MKTGGVIRFSDRLELPFLKRSHRQIRSTFDAPSDLVCALRPVIAGEPPTVQIGGFVRAVRSGADRWL
jgi:hypothetical protein